MPILRQYQLEIEIRPFVEEAIAELGFVRAHAIEWLSEKIVEHANKNHGRSIREEGQRMTPDERLRLGLPRYEGGPISAAVWDVLTESGRRDPMKNFDDTVSRALGCARQALQKASAAKFLRNGVFVGVVMSPPPGVGLCKAGLTMAGKFLPEPPDLPWPECDWPVCYCGWRLVTKSEEQKYQAPFDAKTR